MQGLGQLVKAVSLRRIAIFIVRIDIGVPA
jgi:hypothetical protein